MRLQMLAIALRQALRDTPVLKTHGDNSGCDSGGSTTVIFPQRTTR